MKREKTPKKQNPIDEHDIYVTAEANANLYNLRCVWILIVLSLTSILLNKIGVFKVEPVIMYVSMILTVLLLMIPCGYQIINDRILKKPKRSVETKMFKRMLLITVYVCIILVSIALTFHAILLMALPLMMASQYRYSRKANALMIIAGIVLVIVAIYGSYFLGLPDRNFLKDQLTYDQALDLSRRLEIATPKRMLELFTHYGVPRLLGILTIAMLSSAISKRHAWMLQKQSVLASSLTKELKNRSEMQNRVIEDMAGIIETRDVGTGAHIYRTKNYVSVIAHALQKREKYKDFLTDEVIGQIVQASPLHDVGKIAISDTILLKPGRFTPEEFEEMKKHAEKGGELIRHIFAHFDDRQLLDRAYQIAVYHHERWDGTGYPKGLKGEEIPLCARIMAIADVYDALVSERVYKKPIPPEEAFRIIEDGAGTHFDPEIVEALKEAKEEFIASANEKTDTPEP